jgi:hypothetical protein
MAEQQRKSKYSLQEARLPLIGAMTNRDESGTKDQRFINIFPETRKVEAIESTRIFLNKRPGLTLHRSYGEGNGRGAAWFRDRFYVAVDGQIWEDSATPTSVITLTDETAKVGMLVANSSTIGDYLFICDGTSGWIIESDGTISQITDTQVSSVTITNAGSSYETAPTVVFTGGGGTGVAATATVDAGAVTEITITNPGSGYTSAPTVSFTGGGGSGAAATAVLSAFPSPHIPSPTFIDGYILLAKGSDVYNCTLDSPTEWASGEYLSAEMFPDPIVALARQNNQVVVFGESSIEFFYDAANTSGSPLNRNESSTIQLGAAFPYAIYQNEKSFIFTAQSESGGRAVWQVEGFQPKKVSDEYIDRILDKETDNLNVHGFGVRTMGHLFYLVNLPTLNRTLVYDTEEKLWHEWSTNSSDTHVEFECDYMVDNQTGSAYLLHKTNGKLYKLDTTAYSDDGTIIITEIITNRYDMNTYKRKFMSNIRIVGDRYSVGNSIDVRWTDTDYVTWSNYKTITLSDDFPNHARLGSFRRRAFDLKHTLNLPLRLESIEVSFYEGDS